VTAADATVGLVDDPAVPAAKAALEQADAKTHEETHEKTADSVQQR
jgi:hypothetical protein